MLALLQEIEAIDRAEVDHQGLVLRIHCVSPDQAETCAAEARQRLAGAGFETNLLHGAGRQTVLDTITRWYDLDTVDELSREERATLGERSAPGTDA